MTWTIGILWLILLSVNHTKSKPQVFLTSNSAHAVLERQKRDNFLFEELRFGNLKRECYEETCVYEEAREFFEDTVETVSKLLSKDKCITSPCENGDVCRNRGYNCTCQKGFQSKNCGQVGDNCAPNPCQNGGTCYNSTEAYSCICRNGYHGTNCEHGVKDCTLGICHHFCKPTYDTYICYCAKGYILGKDAKSCIPAEPYPCGNIFVPPSRNHSNLDFRAIDEDQQSNKGEYPWQVLLRSEDNILCGGAILNEDFVLTSAHCVNRLNSFQVIVGEHNLYIDEGSEQIFNVSKTHIHSRYSPETFENDIALIKLEEPINFNNFTLPICLPEKDFADVFLMNSEYGATSGWKVKERNVQQPFLLSVPFAPFAEYAKCEKEQPFPVVHKMFCAGFEEIADPMCYLTKGSPFVTKHRGVWFLTGILSLGAEEFECTLPIYTKVSRYVKWIQKMTKK
uniref:Coagulation factor X-like n=1 Tax=Callorhinchus milii TaxID=7868 RepID=A0A4W3J0E0_CALMI